MKTLSEIRRDIVSFYSTIQQKINDFSFGSVVSGIFYSVSAALENVYREVRQIENQAYIATASGEYLDRLIEGTFQLQRDSATRSFGYLTIYADSPLPDDVVLNYADFDEENFVFTSSTNPASKFIGFPSEGDEGIVFVLTQPQSGEFSTSVNPENKTLTIPAGSQYAILRVAASQTGASTNLGEGKITSFPSAPQGISGVINTSNPGLIFATNEEYTGGAPFSARFTTIRGYNQTTGNFEVDNAFNFSNAGSLEISKDVFNNALTATYVAQDGSSISRGLILDYISSSTSTISLKQPILNNANIIPSFSDVVNGTEKTYTLENYSFGATFLDLSDIQNTIFNIDVTVPGSNYDPNNPPTVTISGDGTGATAVANVSAGGAVGSITVTNPGFGYTEATVTIGAPTPPGTTAQATAVIGSTSVFLSELSKFVSNTPSLVMNERRTSISQQVVFDPDNQLLEDNTLASEARISGGSNQATDNEYRAALQTYLSGLGRSTTSALASGALSVDGITYATVLPEFLSPPGSTTLVASDSNGFLPAEKLREVKNEIDANWKAAGINIVVKEPKREDLHVSLSVKVIPTLTNLDVVTQEIVSQTQNYFNALAPGQKVSYSDLITLYNSNSSVENVFNIIITKRLTDETYTEKKEQYEERFLTDLTETNIANVSVDSRPSNPLSNQLIFNTSNSEYEVYDPDLENWQTLSGITIASGDEGDILVYNNSTQSAFVYGNGVNATNPLSDYEGLNFNTGQYVNLGIIYAVNGAKEFIQNIPTKDKALLVYRFYNDLITSNSVSTVSELRALLETYKSQFPLSEKEFFYVLSYLFSEPIDAEIITDYPIDPALVRSETLQDYTASQDEIYKLGNFTYNGVITPSVGINYL